MNMVSRISRYSLGLLALLAAQWASAVGLGEIQLQSAMNEPLRAEIALLSVGDLNESQIAAKLASPEDFHQAGIEREFQLVDIRFKVDLSNSAHPVIRVSSQHPMKEPYLNFLLELRWTSGRLLREYTLLMDLPVFAGAPPAGKTVAAVPSTAAVRPRSESSASEPLRRPQTRSAVRSSAPTSAVDGSYRVQAGDTLWNIAMRNQPPGVTMQQAMQAIRAANPDAFIRANPNLIRRDAVLKLPDAATMAAVDHRLASSRLRTAQPASDPVIESRAGAAEKPVSGNENGELHLSGGASSANVTSGVASVGGRQSGSASAAAHADIGTVMEENDRIERENAELRARVANLEEQVKTASRLAEINAPALAALQNGEQKVPDTAAADTGKPAGSVATGAVAPTGEAPVSGLPADAAKNAEADMVAGETGTTAQAPSVPEGSVAAPAPGAADAVVPPVTPAAAPVDEGPVNIVAKLRSWLVPALGLTGLLLLVALGLAAVRGRATQQQGLQLPNEFEAKGTRTAAFDGALTAPVTLDDEDLLPAAPGFREGPDQILEEVDVCLSFGNQEQARELLVGALDLYPGNVGLHLKMLELLAQQGDRPGFEVAFSKLRTLGDGSAMETANALLRELEEQDTAPTSVAPEELAPVAVAPVAETAPPVVAEPLDFDLNFDLDLDLPAESPRVAATIQTPPESSDNLEDFDLDLRESDRANSADNLADGPAASTAESWQSAALDSDLDLFETGQEMATQIELAEAYVDMGDAEGAREILDYVLQGGDEAQKESARQLLARLG
ncbi:MAG: LysM peptidoglycan-binding domain-containing protein [Gammaproteobacteria bacterium]|nr:LysM peptidoglycan-binding domain-containing protein [Gammaproteobacteria bacterium]